MAVGILRRQGLINGTRQLTSAVTSVLRPIPPGDILLVGGWGPSTLYRVVHVAEELRLQGFRCSTASYDNPRLSRCATRFRLFVFHRTPPTVSVGRLLVAIKAMRRTALFDIDDLVFDPDDLRHADAFRDSALAARDGYAQQSGRALVEDNYLDTCTVTTTPIAEKLRARGKTVFVVPNRLSAADVRIADCLRAHRRPSAPLLRLGYFSGTASHNRDFATLAPSLAAVMARHPQVRLHIVGPLRLDAALEAFASRIEQRPFVASRSGHFSNLAAVDVNLAPLETGNPFCEAKSPLKFFEAGILGVPTAASATQPFREAVRNGEDGVLVETPDGWEAALDRLIDDAAWRDALGRAARTTAMQRFTTTHATNEPYYAHLRHLAK